MFSDGLVMSGVAFLLYGVSYDNLISRLEGIVFLILYFTYIWTLLKRPSSEIKVNMIHSNSPFVFGFLTPL